MRALAPSLCFVCSFSRFVSFSSLSHSIPTAHQRQAISILRPRGVEVGAFTMRREREFAIDNLLFRIYFIIWWTCLAPWILNSLFQVAVYLTWNHAQKYSIEHRVVKPIATSIFIDRLRVGWLSGVWEGYHESRRCSRDTYP